MLKLLYYISDAFGDQSWRRIDDVIERFYSASVWFDWEALPGGGDTGVG